MAHARLKTTSFIPPEPIDGTRELESFSFERPLGPDKPSIPFDFDVEVPVPGSNVPHGDPSGTDFRV